MGSGGHDRKMGSCDESGRYGRWDSISPRSLSFNICKGSDAPSDGCGSAANNNPLLMQ